jgi:putative nucleotidyltransferase with HDIG domain
MPWGEAARQAGFFASAAFPLISRGHTFGALNLYSQTSGFFHSKRLELFQTIAHHAASVLENARLFEEAQRRLKHIEALRTIDMAITGSLEPQHALNVALEQIVCQLEVDAVSLLRLNPSTQTLEYAAGRGFHTRTIEQTSLRLGEGLAGRAALEQRTVYVPNLSERSGFTRTGLFTEEGFVTYYAVPLIARGRVLGVLEIFHRSLHVGSDEWHEFLRNLVEQTVIAIDNAELFHNLERSNIELVQAYDVTIEGWAYALDLKDKETEGHSRRVMELTLRIAREMGVKEEELVHIRRGALLHDIGKMGIHDAILLKPRKLTDEEWEIMQKHPVYAYQMLSRIEYLRPALDIPYCHHEKWDGSGYPQGLKGEEIPLPARIFAVVDTYDALTNHRPYRKAWPKEKALEYLHEQSGKHFDPRVVEVFLALDDFDSFNKKKQEEPK